MFSCLDSEKIFPTDRDLTRYSMGKESRKYLKKTIEYEYYMDPEHLNTKGAKLYTKVLWDVVSRSSDENKGRFFDFYAESLKNREPEILGLYYSMEDPSGERNADGSPIYASRKFSVASTRDDMRYRITYHTRNDEQEKIIDEDSDGRSFVLPVGERGTITVSSTYEDKDLSLSVDF